MAFNGLSLACSPGHVMTPRSASEQLVARASTRLAGRAARVADVGTGTGAIAIALARARPEVEVWATDTSRRACVLARDNVRLNGLADSVFVEHGDLLEPVPGPLDLIVANLPYLAASTAPQHPDLRGEPFDAVFAPGEGLDPYRRLVAAAAGRLTPDGALLLQLRRRVVVSTRDELPELRHALGPLSRAAVRSALDRACRSREPARRPDRLSRSWSASGSRLAPPAGR